jgi:ribonucleotide monophosphatase NagD (HAD superfamily)
MHRNPWWLTQAGPTLDSGALVVGLEYATARRAVVAGKPAPTIFREAVDELTRTLAAVHRDHTARGYGKASRLRRDEVAMVGDDLRTDLAPARRLGMRTVLVLTGKHGEVELRAEQARRRGFQPDAVASSVVDVARALASPAAEGGATRRPTEATG